MSPLLLSLLALLLLSAPAHSARILADKDKDVEAPAPSSSSGDENEDGGGGSDIEDILKKNGQFKTFIRMLDETHAGDQIDNQLKNNNEQGMTVFAPNDNAFNNLKSGTVNDLTDQQKTQLVQYHIVPKYYNLTTLQDASNPVQTQATGQNGQMWGINVTAQNNQVNVSSANIAVPVTNALSKGPPLMVFELNQVLLPQELFSKAGSKNATGASDSSSPPPGGEDEASASAKTPAGAPEGSGASSVRGSSVLMGLVLGLVGLFVAL